MKRIFFIIFSIAFIGFLAACSSKCVHSYEATWNIAGLEKNELSHSILESEISIVRKSGTTFSITGNSGINNFFGDIKISGSKLKVKDNLASTKMAGSPEAMEFEDLFLECLNTADKIFVKTQQDIKYLYIVNTKKNISMKFTQKEATL